MSSGKNGQPEEEFVIPKQNAPVASDDDQAESEAAAFAFGLDIKSEETQTKFKKLARQDAVDGLASWILRAFMFSAAILVIASFFVLFFHFLAPESWLYLSPERISRLKELLLSGGVGAALAAIGKSSILDKND
ncbi:MULTISPECIES: hypothetical protein [unclassified Ruegeria]|uniref:hypothetical protein n=1 Tax=unclassified Ruegeria TaxID=2625375 RepID=UPI0014889C5E|nr:MULTISPECIES: hypothetical protein [unclassified Ruegeria]NOD64231.1 hypothetical protein [Ruegeria sp. HKCCD6109]